MIALYIVILREIIMINFNKFLTLYVSFFYIFICILFILYSIVFLQILSFSIQGFLRLFSLIFRITASYSSHSKKKNSFKPNKIQDIYSTENKYDVKSNKYFKLRLFSNLIIER